MAQHSCNNVSLLRMPPEALASPHRIFQGRRFLTPEHMPNEKRTFPRILFLFFIAMYIFASVVSIHILSWFLFPTVSWLELEIWLIPCRVAHFSETFRQPYAGGSHHLIEAVTLFSFDHRLGHLQRFLPQSSQITEYFISASFLLFPSESVWIVSLSE